MASSTTFLFSLALVLFYSSLAFSVNVTHDGRALVVDGKRRILISGSIHYPRSTPGMWPDLIDKAKEGGLDAIETYIFWNAHEPRRREYHFEDNLDFIRFFKEIQNAGMYAILRIGPYVCAEWNYGGLPVWLHQIKGMEIRTDNQLFKDEMQNFTALIVSMVKEAKLFASQGGPIILAQIENEYGNIEQGYGDAGKQYISWCANMAESLGVEEPWIMCQQADAPQPMINTCNGFYCDHFTPNNPSSPKIWTENWSGWFKDWTKATPHRQAEEIAYAVVRFFQFNGTLQNYYMYHGGTNFGRTAGPYITTSYDYDSPIDEYGNLRQPKYGHLKDLHAAIKMMENALTYGDFSSEELQEDVWLTTYSGNGINPGCFLANNNSTDVTVNYKGNSYSVPGYSVSILPDCKKEVYNTAKVNVPKSTVIMKPAGSQRLAWSWRPENLKHTFKGKRVSFKANKLVEQKKATGDASDYLWYMTSVHMSNAQYMTLRVNTSGQGLYAFVNGRLVGSQYANQTGTFKFTFEARVSLKQGKNTIALLSTTVGLPNYGAHFDEVPFGIDQGPVQLIGTNTTMDLTSNTWFYKIGLDGENAQFFSKNVSKSCKWRTGSVASKMPFVWYKATFELPSSADPIVIDLQGMGKGVAWINGQSIGRYWPSFLATSACNANCDIKKQFDADNNSCRTGCNEPTQRWYHVPRSFQKTNGKPNTALLFEEAGGDPSQVNFQTITSPTA